MVCPVCGNKDFQGLDPGKSFTCPVPGCGWVWEPGICRRVVLRGETPGMEWMKQQRRERKRDHRVESDAARGAVLPSSKGF